MKAKGIKKCLLKSGLIDQDIKESVITPEDYKKCLIESKKKIVTQYKIRSWEHIVKTEKVDKVALNPADEKRYLIPGCTDTLPWGHYKAIDKELYNDFDEEDLDLLGRLVNIDNESILPTPSERELIVGETNEIQPYEATELILCNDLQSNHLKRNLIPTEELSLKKAKR